MNKQRTFIIGDIHGEYDKLTTCLKAVNFDYENDRLIQLGDVGDRGPDTYMVVEELMKIKNLISLKGNHDEQWLSYLTTGQLTLMKHGQFNTLDSYVRRDIRPEVHFDFFVNQLPYYIDEDNNLFIHGGFNRHKKLKDQEEFTFLWDRDLWLAALSFKAMKDNEYKFKIKESFNHIYIGHTPTTYHGSTLPLTAANITNLDQGSGKGGKLTIFNLDTKEYWQA